jgi:hypothetical protein
MLIKHKVSYAQAFIGTALAALPNPCQRPALTGYHKDAALDLKKSVSLSKEYCRNKEIVKKNKYQIIINAFMSQHQQRRA